MAAGRIDAQLAVAPGQSGGWVLPGIPNLHSHAFQRAMAGLAERQTHPQDSFWTWRETMYRIAARFDPDSLQVVAAQLYAEMLEAGYTTVCEFHYLHHAPDGRPYADPAAMSRALIAAARDTGIRLTLLPVLYMAGGFDGRPLSERQRRFGRAVEPFLRLLDALRARDGLTHQLPIPRQPAQPRVHHQLRRLLNQQRVPHQTQGEAGGNLERAEAIAAPTRQLTLVTASPRLARANRGKVDANPRGLGRRPGTVLAEQTIFNLNRPDAHPTTPVGDRDVHG